jgi:hypothetical protein
MKAFVLTILAFLWLSPWSVSAFPQPEELFPKIELALKTGDTDSLSKWFAPTLDLEILGDANICSKNHAKQIIKDFFAKYSPKNFSFIHQSGKGQLKYGIGVLYANEGSFRITLFVSNEKEARIQQIRIERD